MFLNLHPQKPCIFLSNLCAIIRGVTPVSDGIIQDPESLFVCYSSLYFSLYPGLGVVQLLCTPCPSPNQKIRTTSFFSYLAQESFIDFDYYTDKSWCTETLQPYYIHDMILVFVVYIRFLNNFFGFHSKSQHCLC